MCIRDREEIEMYTDIYSKLYEATGSHYEEDAALQKWTAYRMLNRFTLRHWKGKTFTLRKRALFFLRPRIIGDGYMIVCPEIFGNREFSIQDKTAELMIKMAGLYKERVSDRQRDKILREKR